MSLDSHRPVPHHLPCETVSVADYSIPSYLGIFLASPPTSGTWLLPPNVNIVSGASLLIRNAGPGQITLIASPDDVIDGPAMIPAEFSCSITTDFTNNWRVMCVTPIAGTIMPPVSGSTTFQITSGSWIVQSTTPAVIGYFPWAQSVYSAVVSGFLTVSAEVPGPDFTIRMRNGNTVLASQIISASGVFTIPITVFPTGNAKLEFDVMRNQQQPLNPSIFGLTLSLQN